MARDAIEGGARVLPHASTCSLRNRQVRALPLGSDHPARANQRKGDPMLAELIRLLSDPDTCQIKTIKGEIYLDQVIE